MADPRHDLLRTMGSEAAKAAPPTVVTAYAAISTNLPVLVGFATLLYIVLQAAHLIWRWSREIRTSRAAAERGAAEPALQEHDQ